MHWRGALIELIHDAVELRSAMTGSVIELRRGATFWFGEDGVDRTHGGFQTLNGGAASADINKA